MVTEPTFGQFEMLRIAARLGRGSMSKAGRKERKAGRGTRRSKPAPAQQPPVMGCLLKEEEAEPWTEARRGMVSLRSLLPALPKLPSSDRRLHALPAAPGGDATVGAPGPGGQSGRRLERPGRGSPPARGGSCAGCAGLIPGARPLHEGRSWSFDCGCLLIWRVEAKFVAAPMTKVSAPIADAACRGCAPVRLQTRTGRGQKDELGTGRNSTKVAIESFALN